MCSDNLLTAIPWEDLEPGAVFGPYRSRVSQQDRTLWARIYEDTNGDCLTVPPGLIPIVVLRALRQAFAGIPKGGILARQRFRFVALLDIDQQVETTMLIGEKYVRRGRPYVTLDFSIRLPEGDQIAESRMTLVWPRKEEGE